jgi:4-amino-4-deoxy-L-arabinose transferase-like glycosyltransferase
MKVLRRFIRGRETDPTWVQPLLLTLLGATALLYLVGLGRSGWANAFYSAAVQAGASSWKALFFGSSDAASFITVDKPPLSLWVMAVSARLFGVSSWSILLPQALVGVAAVGVLYATVRRWASPAAGLLAGAVLALTPVATLMFRFNNPDALLVLLLTLAAYTTVRALERGSARWLALTGVLIGCGFMTKMLQAFLVVPVFALVYLIAAPTPLRRRLWHLLVAGAALVVSSGWWVAVVELWPKASRPYIGGSQTNSVLELIFGYNGLGRITGNETGSVVPGGTGQAGAWGATGIWRMFNASWGGQIAWLLPAALVFGVALLWLTRRAPRTDRTRAATLLWGGTLLVTLVVFSLGKGIIHEYYAVALAPPIGALVGMGAVALWKAREWPAARLTLAAVVLGTSVWAHVLLDRSADWNPWLRFAVVAGGVIAAVMIAVGERAGRRLALAGALAGVVVVLAGPAAYSLQTAASSHTGSLPTAGPQVAGSRGGPGGGAPGGGGMPGGGNVGGGGTPGGTPPAMTASQSDGTPPQAPPGGLGGKGGFDGQDGSPAAGGAPSGAAAGGPGGEGGSGDGLDGAGGGLLDASTPSSQLVALLQEDADRYTWVAAAVGAQSAAGYQLATGDPVMSLGGFNGSDPYPTLAEFKALVAAGSVHYYIGGSSGGGPGGAGGSSVSAVSSWVSENFASQTVDGVTLYDLTGAASSD